ncbi:hypothetical protein [Caulobacter segnis]|uniref:Uncharacterized protein n=1 Tax=Caulobacter segnis TaxID=88688 RepID=A0A2W5X8C5_9CAUL|nr:hypothetical protein [Caulobacter segnis]PZR33221.1 MAG: hypothetical protein DI526_14085 [Caulobacter segnis]
MTATALALALALSQSAPPVDIVVGDIGSRAFVLKTVGFEHSAEGGHTLRGWLCRRAPGMPLRRLAVIAEDGGGHVIWRSVVAPPGFAPGRTHECRVLRIDVPAEVGSQTKLWRLEKP